jgi:cytochrome c oxidase subunit 2
MKNLLILLIIFSAAVLMACSDGKDVKKPEMNSSGISNGEKIYNTSIDEDGNEITYTGGPYSGMMMMGGHLACVSCHGSDGKGGEHQMMMMEMNAPDIRWKVLTGEMKGKGQTEEDYEHQKEEHKGYDFEMFKKGVIDGKHPDGDDMKPGMPRWNMSDKDLRDLMNYLKSLD